MSWLCLVLMWGQYADVYVPHEPLYVESGAPISVASGRLDILYSAVSKDEPVRVPVYNRLAFSFDGANELGLGFPWVRVDADSGHIFLGYLDVHYKRKVFGSLKYGYLAARVFTQFPTSPDTLSVRQHFGGSRSTYGLGISYTYELPLLRDFHPWFGNLPVVASINLEDGFLKRNHDTQEWEADFAAGFAWAAAAEILPLDYLFAGTALQGANQEFSLIPYVGFRYYWFDLTAGYRFSDQPRFEAQLRIYI